MSDETKSRPIRPNGKSQVIKAGTIGTGPEDGPNGNGTTAERPRTPTRLQDTFIDERNDVLSVINELEDQLDRHQDIRSQLERQLADATEQLQGAGQRAQELEWQCVTLQTRVDALEQLKQEIGALEEELTDANARAQRVGEQFVVADKERTQLKHELKAANKQLDELWPVRKERDTLRTEYRNLAVRIEDYERSQRELIEERTSLQSQVQDMQIAIDQHVNVRGQLENTVREQHDRVRELTQVQDTMVDKIDQLREEKKHIQAQLTHLERENARLVEQRQYFESEVTNLRNQGRAAEAALSSVKKAFTEVRVALSETKTRARRRATEMWPRIGTTFQVTEPELETVGVTGSQETTLGNTGVTTESANGEGE